VGRRIDASILTASLQAVISAVNGKRAHSAEPILDKADQLGEVRRGHLYHVDMADSSELSAAASRQQRHGCNR